MFVQPRHFCHIDFDYFFPNDSNIRCHLHYYGYKWPTYTKVANLTNTHTLSFRRLVLSGGFKLRHGFEAFSP